MDSVGNELPQGQQIFTSELIEFSNSPSCFRLVVSNALCLLVGKSADSMFWIFLEQDNQFFITYTTRWLKKKKQFLAIGKANKENLEETKNINHTKITHLITNSQTKTNFWESQKKMASPKYKPRHICTRPLKFSPVNIINYFHCSILRNYVFLCWTTCSGNCT